MEVVMDEEKITPMRRPRSKREVKRSARVGPTVYDSLYNTKLNKRGGTKIATGITFHPAR